jgi:hypothetical protein
VLPLMQDQQVIEALTPDTAEEALTDSIGTRGVIGDFEYLDTTCLRHPSEGHPKLAIMITDEVLRTRAIGGGLPKLLGRPSVGGRSCHADMDHFAGVQFDHEEGEQPAEEEVRDRQARRKPRSACCGCVGTCSTSVLVALWCARLSYTSEWCACRHECLA